jgi:hypothetical protein
MFFRMMVCHAAATATATACTVAFGVAAARPTQPDPLDPQASVPAAVYRSPLAGYRPGNMPELQPWRDVNDTVSRIGGWRVYLRDGQPAADARPAATAVPTAPSPAVPHAPVKP